MTAIPALPPPGAADRGGGFERVLVGAIGGSTLAVTLAARNLLFPDDAGSLVVLLTLVGLGCSQRVLRAGLEAIPAALRRVGNTIIVLLAFIAFWSYLVQTGVVAGWFDLTGLNLMRISVYEMVRALLMGILWLSAFRSFSLFTHRDLLLTLVPNLSMLLLICVLDPIGQAMPYVIAFAACAWVALVADQKLRMLEHPSLRRVSGREVAPTSVIAPETRTSLSNLGIVLLVAFAISGTMSRYGAHGTTTQSTGMQLAWLLARFMVDTSRLQFSGYTGPLMVSQPPPPMGNQVMFRVRSDRGGYWRGRAYEHFDGSIWRDDRTRVLRDRITSRDRRRMKRFMVHPEFARHDDRQYRAVAQEYEITTIQMGTLLSLGLPVQVEAPLPDDRAMIRSDLHGCLSCSKSFVAGERFRVVSLLPRNGDGLVLAAEPPDETTRAACLDHENATPRTRELAVQLARNADGIEAKARALAEYLRKTYPYSLGIAPYPRDWDAVDYFLFEARAGYCLQFASALAIMCRAVGVPARLVSGFAMGEIDFTGAYNVRESDAHAWVEIHLRDNVWMQMEATPGITLRSAGHEIALARFAKDLFRYACEWMRQALLIPQAMLGSRAFSLAAVGIVIIVAASLAVGTTGGTVVQMTQRWRRRHPPFSMGAEAELRALIAVFVKRLSRRHRPRHVAETLPEFMTAAHARGLRFPAAQPFLDALQRARYGASAVSAAEIERLRELLARVQPGQ